MIVLEVAIPIPLNKTFYYLPSKSVDPKDIVGKRVKVSFGKRTLVGYAITCQDIDDNNSFKLKYILDVLDNVSLITQEVIKLSEYISKNYICSLGESLASIIPVSMKPPKRFLKNKDILNKIIQERHTLNTQQTNAVNLINKAIDKNNYVLFLLHGVTGSGKTEVYINIIENALKHSKSVIMLIPEISLTPQFVNIMTKSFGSDIGIWHSGVSNIEKYNLFLKAKTGNIRVMIGARSAIFVPFENLGLIIIDEEHEYTYKQDQKPSYDAREIAKWRANYHNGVVVLCSATPSLETYKDALDCKISLIKINERINNKELPEMKIVSLKNRIFKSSLLLPGTVEAISKTLTRKEQIVVFLNRRGYAPAIMCRECGSVYQCSRCSISMIFYKNPDLLKCHYCGQIKRLPITCSVCKSKKIMVFGTGTQKIEAELKKLFQNVKIFRLDGDTVSSKGSYEKVYNGIKNGEYDILLGTQMVSKGFDFQKVSLVCIMDADTSLYLPGFRSVEKTFQLITQVAGLCGRGDVRGSVIVQTNHSNHYVIKCAKNHDFVSFYNIEIEHRKKMFYPPYCNLAKISIKNKIEKTVDEDSVTLFSFIDKIIENFNLRLKLLGPVSAYIAKLDNVYRRYIIVKGERQNILKLADYLDMFKQSCGTIINIEIDPLNLI
ncbi:MAG: primosomal protein N' [Endomicrobium sp.]|jgi:primosomal protein N' (replication factor Y)|nr:primosomal protein N' [Endomicrobium sp.]